jgi:hypothetical protein
LAVNEASGMTAMDRPEGGFWLVNDSGGTPELFGVSSRGALIERVLVFDGWNRDWEGLAKGRCTRWRPKPTQASAVVEPPLGCLFIGNLGSNGLVGAPSQIVVAQEPAPGSEWTSILRTVTVIFPEDDPAKPGRAPDIEAMAMMPDGDMLLFAKWRDGAPAAPVYRVVPPPSAGPTVTSTEARAVAFLASQDSNGNETGPFTDAAANHDGTVVLRDYRRAYRLGPATDSIDGLPVLGLTPITTRPVLQGEAMALDRTGTRLTYTSEGLLPPLQTLRLDP